MASLTAAPASARSPAPPGFADCDDNRANGCEDDVLRDVNHCGDCLKFCSPTNGGTAFCKGGSCGETGCPPGFGDCNGDPNDGCKVDLRSDTRITNPHIRGASGHMVCPTLEVYFAAIWCRIEC